MNGARLLLLLTAIALAAGGFFLVRDGKWPRPPRSSSTRSGTDAALEQLTQAPSDARRWLQLGEEAQRDGQLPLARAAFRAAQELAPDDGQAHARLGFLLYEEGDDAAALVELTRAREKGADVAMLDFTLSMMRAHVDTDGPFPRFSEERPTAAAEPPVEEPPEAPSDDEAAGDGDGAWQPEPPADEPPADEPSADELPADELPADELPADELPAGELPADEPAPPPLAPPGPAGACEIALERKSEQGIFVVDALVNGVSARLIVDTGASLTVLSREFLADTGLALEEDGVLTARTAGGPRRFATAAVESVEVGGRETRGIRVAICEECGMPGSDGLLGLDVQEPLGMSLFPSRGTVRFADCWD